MSEVYGYVRVSGEYQNLGSEEDALKAHGLRRDPHGEGRATFTQPDWPK